MAMLGLFLLMGLMGALLVYVFWATLRWLVTGRKPQVVLVWQQFRTMRQNFTQGGFRARTATGEQSPWGSPSRPSADDQVVDVEVRELPDDPVKLPEEPRR